MSGLYARWLQSPSTGDLASDVSLCYITTTTSINEPTAILKHLTAQAKQVEKKGEKVLSTIEGDNGCCLEAIVTLKFKNGGGAYLPGMDSNMLDEREVTFPLTHIATYNNEGKISQIRLYWDQGTLLKQVEAIGKSGRNWPIRDGEAQVAAVKASIKSGGAQFTENSGRTPASRNQDDIVIREHKRSESVTATRDPHASLALFAERDPNEGGRTYSGPKFETAKSAKPGPREYNELFYNEDSDAAPGSGVRSPSPHKKDGTILKAGAGKYFSGNRLFDAQGDVEPPQSPERKKTYTQKYEHFTFDDGEGTPQKPRPTSNRGKGQQGAGFSFEDFSTPPKHIEKHKPDYERHWGAGVDEDDPVESPPKRPIVHAARKDAEPHFEFTDNSPAPEKKKSLQRQKGEGLYQDPVFEDERTSGGRNKPTATNVNNSRRGDDFDAHYEITDNSPAGPRVVQNKRGTRSDLSSNWGFGSPASEKKIYKTAGDGMGSRAGGRSWGIGDESDPEIDTEVRPSARTRRAQAGAGAESDF